LGAFMWSHCCLFEDSRGLQSQSQSQSQPLPPKIRRPGFCTEPHRLGVTHDLVQEAQLKGRSFSPDPSEALQFLERRGCGRAITSAGACATGERYLPADMRRALAPSRGDADATNSTATLAWLSRSVFSFAACTALSPGPAPTCMSMSTT
jgi:hypothetical protein